MTTLEVTHLKVRYGSAVAVDGVSFTAPSSTVTAVVGPTAPASPACSGRSTDPSAAPGR